MVSLCSDAFDRPFVDGLASELVKLGWEWHTRAVDALATPPRPALAIVYFSPPSEVDLLRHPDTTIIPVLEDPVPRSEVAD